jgi:hypothetical protein
MLLAAVDVTSSFLMKGLITLKKKEKSSFFKAETMGLAYYLLRIQPPCFMRLYTMLEDKFAYRTWRFVDC